MKDSLPSLPASRDPAGLRNPPTSPAPGPAPLPVLAPHRRPVPLDCPRAPCSPQLRPLAHRELRTDSVLGSGFSPARMEAEPGDPAPDRTGQSGRSPAPRPLPPTNPAHARGLLGSSQPGSAGRSHPTEPAGARGKGSLGYQAHQGVCTSQAPRLQRAELTAQGRGCAPSVASGPPGPSSGTSAFTSPRGLRVWQIQLEDRHGSLVTWRHLTHHMPKSLCGEHPLQKTGTLPAFAKQRHRCNSEPCASPHQVQVTPATASLTPPFCKFKWMQFVLE